MSELIDQLQRVQEVSFEDARNIGAWVVMATLPATVAVASYDYFVKPKSTIEGIKGSDDDLLPEAARVNNGRLWNRVKLWAPPIAGSLGLSLLGVQALDPELTNEYEVEETLSTQVLNVVDASTSMRLTTDMDGDTSRLDIVDEIIANSARALPDGVEMGSIVFGANVEVDIPLTRDINELVGGVDRSMVDPNGGSLVEALELAESVLGGSSTIAGESLAVFTDGTVETPGSAANIIESIADDGKKVTIVLTGTNDGSFERSEFDAEPTDSSVKSGPFNGLDDHENITVVQTTNVAVAQQLIGDTITTTKTITEKEPVVIFGTIGVPLIMLAGLSWLRRTRKRI